MLATVKPGSPLQRMRRIFVDRATVSPARKKADPHPHMDRPPVSRARYGTREEISWTKKTNSLPVIGFLDASTAADTVYRVSAFRDGLKKAGFIDGHNVAIEFRWAENKHDQLPALAADLAQRQVAVIVGPNTSMRVARAATLTIPIVFISGGDPIETGLVTNLSRPGGNITGVTYGSGALQPKRLGLLHELVPRPATIAWLGDPRAPTFETEEKEVPRAARELGRQLLVLNAQSVREIDAAFATIVQSRAGALLIGGSILFNNRRRQLAALAARHGVPAIKSTYSAP